jgi:hypothetical protein
VAAGGALLAVLFLPAQPLQPATVQPGNEAADASALQPGAASAAQVSRVS